MTVCVCVGFIGCGGGSPPQPPVESSLQKLAVIYGQYLGSHRGQAPVNEQELREFLETMSESERQKQGITDISKFFQSPRDGQPYVVRYGVQLGAPGPDGAPWVAHEKTGQAGKRFIAFSTGQMDEVDEAKFQAILSAQK